MGVVLSEKTEWSDEVKQAVKDIVGETGIPRMPSRDHAKDSYTTEFAAFRTQGTYVGRQERFGGVINDDDYLFYSLNEPVGKWWVSGVADDIWDNWFKVVDKDNVDSDTLDRQIQRVLKDLKAKTQLPRETLFERRYGTSILLLSYSGFENDWETPLYEIDDAGNPQPLTSDKKLLQITPYPWTEVNVIEVESNENSLRFGLPTKYQVTRGAPVDDRKRTTSIGTTTTDVLTVHWTRVIHDAPRLDEHPYEGVSALQVLFDDLVGGRNIRWAMYQAMFRHGQGFPVIMSKATQAQNEAWIAAGGLDEYLNVRGYFMHGPDEDFRFEGAKDAMVNPSTYFDVYFTFIAAATGVSKSTIMGVSAGRVMGSESDERQYFKAITLQQHKKEPMLTELIDRLIQTGQVEFNGDYEINWVDPFEVNPQDKAAIEFMEERTNALKTYMTINERRALEGLDPLPDDQGEALMLQPGQNPTWGGTANQTSPERGETEPENTEKPESTLLDRVLEREL